MVQICGRGSRQFAKPGLVLVSLFAFETELKLVKVVKKNNSTTIIRVSEIDCFKTRPSYSFIQGIMETMILGTRAAGGLAPRPIIRKQDRTGQVYAVEDRTPRL